MSLMDQYEKAYFPLLQLHAPAKQSHIKQSPLRHLGYLHENDLLKPHQLYPREGRRSSS